MAKIGLEIEGKRHFGKRTLFVSAHEAKTHSTRILGMIDDLLIEQVYISDRDNDNPLDWYASVFGNDQVDITIEVEKIESSIPASIGIMLNITDGTSIEQLNLLRDDDEIKVSNGLNVWSWSKEDAIRTHPKQFESDVQVIL